MSILEEIITSGNRSLGRNPKFGANKIRCKDGFTLSVIAGEGTYCSPRPHRYGGVGLSDVSVDYPGPYHAVEVGYPSERPEPWNEWRQYAENTESPIETVYGYVPVDLVRALVEAHGGES